MNSKVSGFLGFWVVNALVFLVFSMVIFRQNIVLGNARLAAPMAAVISGLILAALVFFVTPLAKTGSFKVKSDYLRYVVFLVVNFVGLWIIKRFADFTGLGVTSYLYVFLLAVVCALGQLLVARATHLKVD